MEDTVNPIGSSEDGIIFRGPHVGERRENTFYLLISHWRWTTQEQEGGKAVCLCIFVSLSLPEAIPLGRTAKDSLSALPVGISLSFL